MKNAYLLSLATAALVAFAGCGQEAPSNDTEEPKVDEVVVEAPAEVADNAPVEENNFSETGNQTKLDPIALDAFTVESLHIGDVSKGHFNLYVKGGEPAVVRAWVGDEAASNVVVTKAEFEVDHHCAHIEVPQPLAADAKLWVELETADGTRMKGSTELK